MPTATEVSLSRYDRTQSWAAVQGTGRDHLEKFPPAPVIL